MALEQRAGGLETLVMGCRKQNRKKERKFGLYKGTGTAHRKMSWRTWI